MISKEKQIRSWLRKLKQEIQEVSCQNDRDYIVLMWQGYLTGMRLTNAITQGEYRDLYKELSEYVSGLEPEQEGGQDESEARHRRNEDVVI